MNQIRDILEIVHIGPNLGPNDGKQVIKQLEVLGFILGSWLFL